MLEFEQVLNFEPLLKEQSQILLHEFITENSSTHDDYQMLLTQYKGWKLESRIIGKEISGVLLFTWQTPEYKLAKTFIASYNTTTNISKVIFYEQKSMKIVNASINDTGTLLAFTIADKSSKLDHHTNSTEKLTFNSFIAEIAPKNRVYSLNIEWSTYQKVQFLSSDNTRSQSTFHMVFCNHKNSIQFYELRVKRVGDGSVILTQQPSTKQIAGQFLWSMFDASYQRLYYLQLLPQDEEELEAAAVLTAIEFNGNGVYQYVINFILPIKFKMELLRANSVYDIKRFSNTVSSVAFNMSILTDPRGSLYVCYQQPVTENRYIEDESSGDDLSVISEFSSHDSILQMTESANCHVNYAVICVHSAFTAHCSSIIPYREDEVVDYRVHFILFNDYLLVFLPGFFLHFLDISCEHEPVHSLLVRRKQFLPIVPTDHQSPCFIPYGGEKMNRNKDGSRQQTLPIHMLFETNTGSVYKLDLNCVAMYKFFLASKAQTRLSVLHACLNHFREYTMLSKKIMTRICQDPSNSDSSLMLKELLVLFPYVELKQSVSLLDLKVFPFTTQSCYRGQVERNSSGHRDVYLSFKYFKEDLVLQIKKVLRDSKNVFWKELLKYLCFETDHRNRRVPLNIFYMVGIEARQTVVSSPSKTLFTGRRNTSFVIVPRGGHNASSGGGGGMDDSVLSVDKKMSIDDSAFDETQRINNSLNTIATRCIVNYVTRFFGQETKPRVKELCVEYMRHRVDSISRLWKIILKALDKSDEVLRFRTLSMPTDELEIAVFQLVERIKVICDHLCYPQFFRMDEMVFTLSLRCLTMSRFLTYLNAQVFTVNTSLVRRVIRDLPDNQETRLLIEGLLTHLTKVEAHRLMIEWNHPIGNQYLAEYVSWKMSSSKIHAPPPPSNASANANFEQKVFPNGGEFMPLKTLLHAFTTHGKTSNVFGSGNRGDKRQNDLLMNVGLAETENLLK